MNEVATDAEVRDRAKQTTPWIGYQSGDKPLRHRCVRPKDAKQGNLVLLDVRNACNDKDVLLGDWEGYCQLATVSSRQVDDNDVAKNVTDKDLVIHLVMWEPYYTDEADKSYRPLWVENVLRYQKGHDMHPNQ